MQSLVPEDDAVISFVSRKDIYRDVGTGSADQWEYRLITTAGRCLITSAAYFGIFGILLPLLARAIQTPHCLAIPIRYHYDPIPTD